MWILFKIFILFQRSINGKPALHSVLTANSSHLMQKNQKQNPARLDEIECLLYVYLHSVTAGVGEGGWRAADATVTKQDIYNADYEDEALLVVCWAHREGEGGWGTSLIGRDREWGEESFKHLYRHTQQKWPFVSIHNTKNISVFKLFFSLLKKRMSFFFFRVVIPVIGSDWQQITWRDFTDKNKQAVVKKEEEEAGWFPFSLRGFLVFPISFLKFFGTC